MAHNYTQKIRNVAKSVYDICRNPKTIALATMLPFATTTTVLGADSYIDRSPENVRQNYIVPGANGIDRVLYSQNLNISKIKNVKVGDKILPQIIIVPTPNSGLDVNDFQRQIRYSDNGKDFDKYGVGQEIPVATPGTKTLTSLVGYDFDGNAMYARCWARLRKRSAW